MTFWKSDTYKVVKALKSAQKVGLIEEWVQEAGRITGKGQDFEAIQLWLPLWQHRPFYTASELAPLIPALALGLGIALRWKAPHSPARMRNELIMAGLLRLTNVDGTTYFGGREYFIVERFGFWKNRKLTQGELNDLLTR